MSISFDRKKIQIECEKIINNVSDFKTYVLKDEDERNLKEYVIEDSCCYYYNSIISFVNACESLNVKNFSWACVQLYYSLYYSLRSIMGFDGIVLVRNKSLFFLEIKKGNAPRSKSNKKYNSDHEGTINYYIDSYKTKDCLMNQRLGDQDNILLWMKELRDVTNYRDKVFKEPEMRDVMHDYLSLNVSPSFFSDTFQKFDSDYTTYVLAEKSAWLAIPYHYLSKAAGKYIVCAETFSHEQNSFVIDKLNGIGLANYEDRWLK